MVDGWNAELPTHPHQVFNRESCTHLTLLRVYAGNCRLRPFDVM